MLTSTFDVCALLHRTDAYYSVGVYAIAKVELLSVVVLAVHVVPAGRRITASCAPLCLGFPRIVCTSLIYPV